MTGELDASESQPRGAPDGLDRLWAPHRMAYIWGQGGSSLGGANQRGVCPFCQAPDLPGEDSLVIARGTTVYAVLNLYPYNPGHILICPYRHVADYTELDDAETAELAACTKAAMRALRRTSGPHGFNLGMNQGAAGGAGIAAHLHQHVVPRWGGDSNFISVVAQTRVLPQLLSDTRDLLAGNWG